MSRKQEPNPKISRLCSNCFASMGTQRETTRKCVKRFCRQMHLMVPVTGPDVASCQSWRERPSNAAIARKANRAANERISEVEKGKE